MRIAHRGPINHIESHSIGFTHRLPPTRDAVGCDDSETAKKNSKGAHFQLQKEPAVLSRWGDPHRVVERMANAAGL
jgi:hypothetical protein